MVTHGQTCLYYQPRCHSIRLVLSRSCRSNPSCSGSKIMNIILSLRTKYIYKPPGISKQGRKRRNWTNGKMSWKNDSWNSWDSILSSLSIQFIYRLSELFRGTGTGIMQSNSCRSEQRRHGCGGFDLMSSMTTGNAMQPSAVPWSNHEGTPRRWRRKASRVQYFFPDDGEKCTYITKVFPRKR